MNGTIPLGTALRCKNRLEMITNICSNLFDHLYRVNHLKIKGITYFDNSCF